jgi:hypothetical protein
VILDISYKNILPSNVSHLNSDPLGSIKRWTHIIFGVLEASVEVYKWIAVALPIKPDFWFCWLVHEA